MRLACFSSPCAMETRSASAFSDARDSSAASCKLSLDCARHGIDTRSTRNNNDAKIPNPSPETLTDVFTDSLSLSAQIIERGCRRAPIVLTGFEALITFGLEYYQLGSFMWMTNCSFSFKCGL